jgi:hypothetical protein
MPEHGRRDGACHACSARAKRARKLDAMTVLEAEVRGRTMTTSPQPRRVYIVFDYVKARARRRAGCPLAARRPGK